MAATLISSIITQVRDHLVEAIARFWSDRELTDIMSLGAMDLWGAILDLHGDHYLTINDTTVSLAAGASQLSGVPNDCFRIQLIEPRDVSVDGQGRQVVFIPRKYKDWEFAAARTRTSRDPASVDRIFYQMSGVGAPIAAPVVLVAPQLSSTLALRLAYNPSLVFDYENPIPGGSDNALKAWTIAYASAKENEQGQKIPDPGWLAVYGTEKQTILVRLTPRQEQEPDIVEGMFDSM